jgi:hypothetical protein
MSGASRVGQPLLPTKSLPTAPPKRKTAPRVRAVLPFKGSDVTRAVRAAQDADVPIGRIEIEGSRITIVPKADTPQPGNSWDDVTNAENTKRPA